MPERAARTVDALHDLLRRLGDLIVDGGGGADRGAGRRRASGWRRWRARAAPSPCASPASERWIAIEDAARYRDALGVALPVGVPTAFLGPGRRRRWTGSWRAGPEATGRSTRRSRPGAGRCRRRASRRRWSGCWRRARSCAASSGRAAPSGNGAIRRSCASSGAARWPGCAARSSRSIRSSWLASCRPGRGSRPVGELRQPPLRGEAALERLAEVVDQLAGVPIPASVLERDVLPARIPGYQPRLLDELGALGEVAWVGRGSLGRDDGRVVLYRPGREALRDLAAGDGRRRRRASSTSGCATGCGTRRLVLP